jgi:hypothetical protein
MNYAIINNGTVINIVLWDGVSPYNPGSGNTLVLIPADTFVNIGYTYNGSTFSGTTSAPLV